MALIWRYTYSRERMYNSEHWSPDPCAAFHSWPPQLAQTTCHVTSGSATAKCSLRSVADHQHKYTPPPLTRSHAKWPSPRPGRQNGRSGRQVATNLWCRSTIHS
eukprot:2616145-Rhodomonas_salina.3